MLCENVSFWKTSIDKNSFPSLDRNISTDVLVIGGGICGITVATLLKEKGIKTILIEANEILSGVTGNTTAKITAQHGLKLHKLVKRFGKEIAEKYTQANLKAIDLMEKLDAEHNTDCSFKRTFACVITENRNYLNALENEADAASLLGINAEYIDRPQFEATKNANVEAALKFYNQAQFNPAKYVNKLAADFNGKDTPIYEHTRALNIIKGSPVKVETDRGFSVFAKKVIIATHFPFFDKHGLYFTKLFPQRSYIYSFTAENGFNEGMFITAENGYSLRLQPFENENLILIAGGTHDTGKGYYLEKNYLDLKDKASRLFKVKQFLWKWSAQDYSTPDTLPYAGQFNSSYKDVYVMTGFDKWGMTNATAAAKIICSYITEEDNPYGEAFNTLRTIKNFSTLVNYFGKNIKTVATFIGGRLTRLRRKSVVKKGEARLVKINGKRAGVYRDEDGKLHIIDSVCKHMGCQLSFNDAEKTWDCPCHGSRYDIDGTIIEAPTVKHLEKLQPPTNN